MVEKSTSAQERAGVSMMQAGSRATLQVLELVRIPYTKIDYRYSDQDYTLYVYDCEGQEKFYADRFPARWGRIEHFVRAITTDLKASTPATTPEGYPPQPENPLNRGYQARGYRVPVEKPPYSINEEDDTY